MMYVMLVVIVMMISGTMIVMMIRDNEINEVEDDIAAAITYIVDAVPEGADADTAKAALAEILGEQPSYYANKRLFVLDREYNVILPVAETGKGLRFPTFQATNALTEGTATEADTKQRIEGWDTEYIGLADGVKVGDDVAYIVYVLGDVSQINDTIYETIWIILMSLMVALVVASLLGFVFSEFLTKPIAALSDKARDMAAGRLDKPIKVFSSDEIGQLTMNFNKMARSLNETLNEITSEKNKLEIVFEHMTDGILVFDRMGVMIHANPASIKMLNLSRQISFQEVFKPYLDLSYSEMKQHVMEETISHMVAVDGKYYSIYFAKFVDQGKEAAGLICVIQDITEHKRLEEMQKEFVANVSHELRTPLTTIKSYAETLMDGCVEDPETAVRFLKVINHEGDRMTALVQDLLELSKLDNSQVNFSMQDINLVRVVEDSVEKHRIHAVKKKQSMIFHTPDFDCKISGDSNRIEQVLKNIITNAVKYSPEEAIIEIELLEKGKYYAVAVTDNGFGIPEEDVQRIFERFYRVDKARSREMGGTGLGLAIAKEIMEQHGGKITVESVFGKGTRFELVFPKL